MRWQTFSVLQKWSKAKVVKTMALPGEEEKEDLEQGANLPTPNINPNEQKKA